MKKYALLLLVLITVSCKTKSVVVSKPKIMDKKPIEKIIDGHLADKLNFSSLYIKANLKYKDPKQTQSVTAEIRIKKDETIMISLRFMGITMAKALITPTKVQYYEKINGKFFDGNYTTLTDFLGTDLDFYKVQNIFIGKAIDDLRKENYNSLIEDKLFKLESVGDSNTKKVFFFDSKYQITKEIISQLQRNRVLEINYSNFKEYPNGSLPETILIDATQENGNATLSFDYSNVSFNEDLNFPYNVPEGYEQIFIKQ